jgi:hypothetical protein
MFFCHRIQLGRNAKWEHLCEPLNIHVLVADILNLRKYVNTSSASNGMSSRNLPEVIARLEGV